LRTTSPLASATILAMSPTCSHHIGAVVSAEGTAPSSAKVILWPIWIPRLRPVSASFDGTLRAVRCCIARVVPP